MKARKGLEKNLKNASRFRLLFTREKWQSQQYSATVHKEIMQEGLMVTKASITL